MHLVYGHLSLDMLIVVDNFPALNEDVFISDLVENPGGAGSNVAAFLAQLGHDVGLFTAVGDDETGRFLQEEISGYRVSTKYIKVQQQPTTRLTCVMDKNGNRSFYLHRGSSFNLGSKDYEAVDYSNIDSLIFNGIPLDDTIMAMKYCQQEIPFYINLGTIISAGERVTPNSLARFEAIFMNGSELETLLSRENITEEKLRELHGKVVITRGKDGSTTFYDGKETNIPAYGCNVVNTLGCGDAFMAGWLASYFDGKSLSECAERGHFYAGIIAGTSKERLLFSETQKKA